MKNTPPLSPRRNVLALGLLACAAATGACSYSTWPPIEDGAAQTNTSQINYSPTPQVMAEALSLVTLRYPPVSNAERGQVYETPFAVCLPPGANAASYDAVIARVQRGAQPDTADNAALQTYYVSRVIVRGVTAEVDVLRPVPELGTDGEGKPRYQGVTVYLTGNLGTWKAQRHHTFPTGMFDVPQRTTRPVTESTWGSGMSVPTEQP